MATINSDDDIDNESKDGSNDSQTRDQIEKLRKLNIENGNYDITAHCC